VIVCAVAGVCAGASSLSAQSVRGTARVAGDGQGSAQTTIALVDTLGAIVAGTTTGERGEYLLHAPHAGTYRVRARRIGFAPDSSSPMLMASGTTVMFDPSMKQLQTQLAEVRVQEARRCVLAPDAGAQALRLWQEAQNALSGAAVNTVSGTNSFVLNRFQRELDSQGKRVIRSTRWQLPAHASETYASISADSLATEGYVKITGSDAIYYAPDARTLLSEPFAQTHCLRPVAGVAGSDSVGLAFEPVGRNHRTEVSGTLWLARSTGKLKYLEFQYIDPTAPSGDSDPRAPHATGRVYYRELPSGAWIISSWTIRVPLIRVTAPRNIVAAVGSFRTDAVRTVTGWWEFGGDVVDVTAAKSDNRPGSFARNSGSLRGTLVDSIVHKGVMGVRVSIRTVNAQGDDVARTITDSSGNFGIDSLRAGDYVLAFSAPRLDTLGVRVPVTSFSIVPEQELTLSTTMPQSDIERACRSQQPDQRAVHGVVRDGTSGTPLSSVSVRMTWVPRASLRGTGFVAQLSDASTVTDNAGHYILCGLPADRGLTATMAETGGRPTKIVIPAGTGAVVLRNVELSAGESNTGTVSGMARSRDGSGIAGAEVSLLDDPDKHAYTDSVGSFKLADASAGFHLLRIRHLGFAPALVQIQIAPHGVTPATVVMTASASVLTTVSVRASSGQVLQLPSDVAHRLTAGQGYYILAGDAKLRDVHTMSDVFRRLQGVTVKGDLAVSTRGINSLLADPCPLGIPLYVNGAPMGNNTLDVAAPSEIAAIEVYPTAASMPPSLHPSPCGAILIWTK
jgi:hypothetical protein